MRPERDIGREQAYRAERRLFGAGKPFDTARLGTEDVRAMVRMIMRRTIGSITFEPGNGHAWARNIGGGELFFTTHLGTVAAWVVLHECAHLLANTGHGDRWRRIYCRLVREWVSPAAAEALAAAFRSEPLRLKSGRPARRWIVYVHEDVRERPLKAVTREEAKALLEPGETLYTVYQGSSIEFLGLLTVERTATREELAETAPADRAAMRRGVFLLRDGGRKRMFARVSIQESAAKAATPC